MRACPVTERLDISSVGDNLQSRGKSGSSGESMKMPTERNRPEIGHRRNSRWLNPAHLGIDHAEGIDAKIEVSPGIAWPMPVPEAVQIDRDDCPGSILVACRGHHCLQTIAPAWGSSGPSIETNATSPLND
jgi:hypothetical protein